jgi:Mrp family chromosome partitioning ATPase
MQPQFYNSAATPPTLTQAQKDNFTAQEDQLQNALLTAAPPPEVQAASNANQTQPQTTRNTIIGLVLGLVLGVILAFLQDLLDKRIRTADEVGRRLRVPLLASIPTPPRSLREHPLVLLAPRGGAQGPSAEAYRIAKLNLGTVMRANRAKAVMFVSAADSEGTSRTAANMAVALARTGSHVVLIDANMRRPAIDGFFGLDDRTGLSDILSGHGDLADALTIVDVGGQSPDDAGANGRAASGGLLEVLPAGPPPADAADLLESRAMAELLGELRGRADIVLIDAPPMLPVTDAMMLGAKVDGVIVVARARLASRPHMVALARALDACAAPTLGFLFTGVSVSAEPACHRHGRRPESANCCESRARLFVGRPPHPASPVEAVVGEARTHLGDLRPARRPVAARGRRRRVGVSPHDAKRAKRDAKPHARRPDAAPLPA